MLFGILVFDQGRPNYDFVRMNIIMDQVKHYNLCSWYFTITLLGHMSPSYMVFLG